MAGRFKPVVQAAWKLLAATASQSFLTSIIPVDRHVEPEVVSGIFESAVTVLAERDSNFTLPIIPTTLDDVSPETDFWQSFAIIFTLLLIIILALLCCCCCCRTKSTASHLRDPNVFKHEKLQSPPSPSRGRKSQGTNTPTPAPLTTHIRPLYEQPPSSGEPYMRVSECQEAKDKLKQNLATSEKNYADLEVVLQATEDELEDHKEKLKTNQSILHDRGKQTSELKRSLKALQDENTFLQKQLDSKDQDSPIVAALKRELNKAKDESDFSAKESAKELENTKKALIEQEDFSDYVKAQRDAAYADVNTKTRALAEAIGKCDDLESELEQRNRRIHELERQLNRERHGILSPRTQVVFLPRYNSPDAPHQVAAPEETETQVPAYQTTGPEDAETEAPAYQPTNPEEAETEATSQAVAESLSSTKDEEQVDQPADFSDVELAVTTVLEVEDKQTDTPTLDSSEGGKGTDSAEVEEEASPAPEMEASDSAEVEKAAYLTPNMEATDSTEIEEGASHTPETEASNPAEVEKAAYLTPNVEATDSAEVNKEACPTPGMEATDSAEVEEANSIPEMEITDAAEVEELSRTPKVEATAVDTGSNLPNDSSSGPRIPEINVTSADPIGGGDTNMPDAGPSAEDVDMGDKTAPYLTPVPAQTQRLIEPELKFALDGSQKRVQQEEPRPAKKPYQKSEEAAPAPIIAAPTRDASVAYYESLARSDHYLPLVDQWEGQRIMRENKRREAEEAARIANIPYSPFSTNRPASAIPQRAEFQFRQPRPSPAYTQIVETKVPDTPWLKHLQQTMARNSRANGVAPSPTNAPAPFNPIFNPNPAGEKNLQKATSSGSLTANTYPTASRSTPFELPRVNPRPVQDIFGTASSFAASLGASVPTPAPYKLPAAQNQSPLPGHSSMPSAGPRGGFAANIGVSVPSPAPYRLPAAQNQSPLPGLSPESFAGSRGGFARNPATAPPPRAAPKAPQAPKPRKRGDPEESSESSEEE